MVRAWALLLICGVLALADDMLTSLSFKNIHILMARHPEYAISEWLSGPKATPFVAVREAPEYARRARIRQDGDAFRIEINGRPVCTSWSSVVACAHGQLFSAEYHKFGYRFMKSGRCLSASHVLTLEPCSSTRTDQEFVLVDESMRYCIEDALSTTPATVAEQQRKNAILKKAAKSKKFSKLLQKPGLEEEIAKLKPSPKTKKALTSLWNKGWGRGWGLPRFRIC